MSDPQRVAVVGATGYAGFELARLLLRHPGIAKPTFYLRESATPVNCLTEIFPQLRGWGEAPCRPFSVEAVAASGASAGVSCHAARGFAGAGAAAAGGGAARGGLERRVPLSRSARRSRAGTSCRRRPAALLARSGLRSAGALWRRAGRTRGWWPIRAAIRRR